MRLLWAQLITGVHRGLIGVLTLAPRGKMGRQPPSQQLNPHFSDVKVLAKARRELPPCTPLPGFCPFLWRVTQCHAWLSRNVTLVLAQSCVTVTLFSIFLFNLESKIALWNHILSWNGVTTFITSWGHYFCNTFMSDKSYFFLLRGCQKLNEEITNNLQNCNVFVAYIITLEILQRSECFAVFPCRVQHNASGYCGADN